MKLVSALTVAALALALAGTAAAALIPLQAGDKVLVYPTRIACTVDRTSASGPVLHCFKGTKNAAPVAGSYQVSIGNSAVAVERITRSGKPTTVFRRTQPKSPVVRLAPTSGRSPTLFALQYGDIPAAIAGTNVFCVVTGKPSGLICDPAANSTLNTTIPGSYGIVITQSALTVTQALDAAGHSKAVYKKNL